MTVTIAVQDGKLYVLYEACGDIGGTRANAEQRLIATVGKHIVQ